MLYSIGKFARMIGVSQVTLRDWDRKGALKPAVVKPNGYRYYSEEQLGYYMGKGVVAPKITIGYCRVSSSKQKDDLDRQVEVMRTVLTNKGNPFRIITDIGSGINYERHGLREIITEAIKGSIDRVVVLYKDRMARFGFSLIEFVLSHYGVVLEVLDLDKKSETEEVVEDIVQIITVYSCKLQGKRSKRTAELVRRAVEDESD